MGKKNKRPQPGRIISIDEHHPEFRTLKRISDDLLAGEVYVYPTDSVYALIADLDSKRAVDTLYRLKDMPKKKPLALQVSNISEATEYIRHLDNQTFRLLKKITPGPFTLIFEANKRIPHYTLRNVNTIGIRISAHPLVQALLEVHPGPILSTSVNTDNEYIIDTEELSDIYGKQVAGIVDGGIINVELSTVIDFTSGAMDVLREGKGADILVGV